MRSFLDLVNFCARFIPDLATVSEPLRRLTRKDVHFSWRKEQEVAFNELKKGLAKTETLGYFDSAAKTRVITDASSVGLGALLVQEQNDEERVICYASRSLTDVEKRYSQTEKEALGIVWACERLHMYLYGTDFEILTDHKPLQFIHSKKSQPLRISPARTMNISLCCSCSNYCFKKDCCYLEQFWFVKSLTVREPFSPLVFSLGSIQTREGL